MTSGQIEGKASSSQAFETRLWQDVTCCHYAQDLELQIFLLIAVMKTATCFRESAESATHGPMRDSSEYSEYSQLLQSIARSDTYPRES